MNTDANSQNQKRKRSIESICWSCRNALGLSLQSDTETNPGTPNGEVDHTVDLRKCPRCPWAAELKPVPGWEIEEMTSADGEDMTIVVKCPLYREWIRRNKTGAALRTACNEEFGLKEYFCTDRDSLNVLSVVYNNYAHAVEKLEDEVGSILHTSEKAKILSETLKDYFKDTYEYCTIYGVSEVEQDEADDDEDETQETVYNNDPEALDKYMVRTRNILGRIWKSFCSKNNIPRVETFKKLMSQFDEIYTAQ